MFTILSALSEDVVQCNWLVSDIECNHYPDSRLRESSLWLTGKELLTILEHDEIQFIWGVFSAFSPELSIAEIMAASEGTLPDAQIYEGYWHLPLAIEHPLATMAIIACDSALVLIVSKDNKVVERFRTRFAMSEDLKEVLSHMNKRARK